MFKRKIMPLILAAAMVVTLVVPTFAATEREQGRTADIVQNNRVYINGDEINAYKDAAGKIYVPADELKGYGFAVDDSFNVTWAGTSYDFDETYMPTTENGGMETAEAVKSDVTVQVGGKEAALYTISGQQCIEATALEAFGYGEYNAEKNLYNVYVKDAGYSVNEEGYRNITVDASNVTGSFKKILGMHYDPGEAGSDTNKVYVEIGTDSLRTHDIDGTSGDGRGIIYNLVPGYFDTIKAINLLKDLKENGGEFKDPEDPVLVNLYPASRMNAELQKCVDAGLITDAKGNYDEQIAALETKLAAIDLTKEDAYDFEATDKVIKNALDIGADILFRFGASQNDIIDNTFPAVDSAEWGPFVQNLGVIATQIVKHYQDGWANGMTDALTYFEIWNEADLLDFWPNTIKSGPDAYWQMYDVVAKAAKAADPDLPIGGPTITTHNDDRGLEASFLKYVKENGSPLDFFSYHYYPSVNADPYDYARWANHFNNILKANGFENIPLFLSEYGTNIFGNPFTMSTNAQNTFHTAALIYMQQSIMERAYSYGRPTGRGGGMSSTYYGYKALKNFQDTNEILDVTGGDKNGMAVLAGTNEAKDKINVVIANYEMPASQMLSNATDESHNPIIEDGKLIPPNQVAKWSLPLARVMTYENNKGYNLTINNIPFKDVKSVNVEVYRKSETDDYVLVDTIAAPLKNGSATISKDLGIYAYDYLSITPGERSDHPSGRTPDTIQNNRSYINGDEIRAFQTEDGAIYVPVKDLAGYGFSTEGDNITWAGTSYDFDETYMPTTESWGMEKAALGEAKDGKIDGAAVKFYDINGEACVNIDELKVFGSGVYDAEKNMYNLWVEAAGYAENEAGFRNVTVDANEITGSFKKILGMHYDPGEEGSDTRNTYVEIGTDSLRTHDIDGTSGDGRGIIYNLVPGYFDTIKAINLLKELKENGGEFKDPEDPILVNLYPASRMNAELQKCVDAGLITDAKGNYDAQIADLEKKLAAIDLTKEEAYDFEATDKVIQNALDIGADILFRFGASQNDIIDNTFPAVDSEEWEPFVKNLGVIATQIVKHYQDGWANGMTDALTYFEIWNEADLLDFWPNTLQSGPTAYWEMYDVVAKAAKAADPDLPIGGPTITTHNDDRGLEASFLKYVKENGSPLDFFSYHYYPSVNADPYEYARLANHFNNLLEANGFKDIPLFLSEYGTNIFGNPFTMSANAQNTFHASALIYMQQSIMERAYSYGRPTGRNGSMSSTYYGYTALKNFQDTNNILKTTGGDKNGFAVLAGINDAKDAMTVMISNYEMPTSQMMSNDTDESHNPIIVDGKLIPPNQVAMWSLPLARVMTYENNKGYNLTINNVPFEAEQVEVEIYRKSVDDDYALVDTVKADVKDGTVVLSKELGIYAYDVLKIKAAETPFQFDDVQDPDAWFYKDVYAAYEYKNANGTRLMSGYGNSNNFGPNDPLVRAQFAVMLHRLDNEPEVAFAEVFPDVKDGEFYSKACVWAKEAGVITGYENGYFGVNDNINREQLATILYRYAKEYKKLDVSAAYEAGDLSKFADASAVSQYAQDALKWANGAGIITGTKEGNIDPQGNAVRAQVAAMFMRYITYINGLE